MLRKNKKYKISRSLEFVKDGSRPENYKKSNSGFAYEMRCKLILQNIFKDDHFKFVDEPWYIYKEEKNKKVRACEPDCLIVDELNKNIYIFEIKEWNYIEGKNDIINLYKPIVTFKYPDYKTYGFVLSKRYGIALEHFKLNEMFYVIR